MMDLKFANIKWRLKLFIILKLFIHESHSGDPMTLANVSSVCCIDRGTKEITNLIGVSQYCTAIARRSNNEETSKNDITILNKGVGLPIVYLYNNKGHHKMKEAIHNDRHRNKFLEKISGLIISENIDVLIFDHFQPESWASVKNTDKVQTHIVKFFTSLKQKFPDKLFGLCLPKDKDDLKDAFKPDQIDQVVDVYLIKSIEYNECTKKYLSSTHQEDMKSVDPTDRMESTVNMIMEFGYKLEKCLLEIRIVVNKVNWRSAAHKNDLSYANYCSHNPKHRRTKFCFESLTQFYEKGVLVKKFKMAGTFIAAVDEDDYLCACECGQYPATQCIYAGATNLSAPLVTNCLHWGHLPRDRAKIDAHTPPPPLTDDSGMDDGDDSPAPGPPPDLSQATTAPGGDPNDTSE